MISKTTKDAIQKATSVTPREEPENSPSDAKIIYAPLLKYGAIAMGIVAIIVTAAVLTEGRVDGFSKEMAQIDTNTEAVADAENQSDSIDIQTAALIPAGETDLVITENDASPEKTAESNTDIVDASDVKKVNANDSVQEKEVAASLTTTPVIAVTSALSTPVKQPYSTAVVLDQHRDFIIQQDQRHLDIVKLNHERHIETLRNRFGQQNSYMEMNIKQLESNYLKQVAAIKRSQNLRRQMSNQI